LSLTEYQREELLKYTVLDAANLHLRQDVLRAKFAESPRFKQIEDLSRYLELQLRHRDRRGRWIHRVRDVFPDWNDQTDILIGVSSAEVHTYIFTDGIRLDTIGMGTFGVQFRRETELLQRGLFVRLRDSSGDSVKKLGSFIRSFRQEDFSINHITCMQQIYSILLKYSGLSIPEAADTPSSSAKAMRLFLSADVRAKNGGILEREIVYTDRAFDPLSLLARLHKSEFESIKERRQQVLSLANFLKTAGRNFSLEELLTHFKIKINPGFLVDLELTKEDASVSPENVEALAQKLADLPRRWLLEALEWGELSPL